MVATGYAIAAVDTGLLCHANMVDIVRKFLEIYVDWGQRKITWRDIA